MLMFSSTGWKHILVVDCVLASKSNDARKHWVEAEGYQEQRPADTGEIMMAPGDNFFVNLNVCSFSDFLKNTFIKEINSRVSIKIFVAILKDKIELNDWYLKYEIS